jgi:hypothetical protein
VLSDFSLLILIINTCIVQDMRTWEPVEVSSQPWTYGQAPSYCGYAPTRTSYGGYAPPSYGYGYAPARTSYGDYAPSRYGYGYAPARTSYGGYAPPSYGYGYAPARTSYGDYAPSSYGYGYAPARTSYGGYAPPSYEYDLPTMDTPSARTFYEGYALMDITLVNCGYASIKDWIVYGN